MLRGACSVRGMLCLARLRGGLCFQPGGQFVQGADDGIVAVLFVTTVKEYSIHTHGSHSIHAGVDAVTHVQGLRRGNASDGQGALEDARGRLGTAHARGSQDEVEVRF